jgi:DNA-nicking Smr family endonuclease
MAKDVDLFAQAMAGVAPLKGRRKPAVVPQPQDEKQSIVPERSRPEAAPDFVAASTGTVVDQPFDRDVDRALSRGKRAPEAKLDLHGMTLVAAERAVARFLAQSSAEGRRVVLIVTGKGLRLEGGRVFGGRIRGEFAGWLERADNRALVAGLRAAHPRHGGSGAFYVLLRRRSSASSRSLRATPQR